MLSAKAPPVTAETRRTVSRIAALYFLRHLEAELAKPDAVLLEDYKDLPVRKITQGLADRVRMEFAIPPGTPLPGNNLFKRWCEINGTFSYEDSSFVGYNQIFLPRLLDLRDGTPESQRRLINAMIGTFDRFDYEKQGFTVTFFLNSESTMRELLRDAVEKNLTDDRDAADYLILSQSGTFQTAMYEYFEGVLKRALAENVRLLHGILPHQVANELKDSGQVEPVSFKDAAVIFTDFESFSQYTEHLSPAEVIRRLDTYFTEFDRISAAHGLEKIKTIGDSYMAVAGVPEPHADPVRAACDAALEFVEASDRISALAGPDGWNIRIGIHCGPLVAGVIGKQKFSYDVWGSTVNFASRMESSGAPGRINVSCDVHRRVEPFYRWEARGPQPVKSLGLAEMFFLLGKV
ncbi:MAG: adenylate/guanylate cyclase domain-containing protein [Verrucomicrobiota bacterium]